MTYTHSSSLRSYEEEIAGFFVLVTFWRLADMWVRDGEK